jgi:cyclophilin family peptidyl-prolyl cis-trans isomerase
VNHWRHILGAAVMGVALLAHGQTDGIYADFTTSLGDFTVRLDYERAPRAVASFVGLATGEKAWADPQGNIWNRPFYDGSIFHRVVQTVDTNGVGSTNGICVQGGGVPQCGLILTNRPYGPANTDSGSFLVVGTNGPGVTTNVFGPISFTTENVAAVPTNYNYAGAVWETNMPVVTRTVIALWASSSNAHQNVVNTYTNDTWYTNRTAEIVTTTNWLSIQTVTTNLGPGNEVLTHRISLSMASTAEVWAIRSVTTNFANAGYYMLDSATNGLAHSNGVISLANSGPNTDGSQFFITATNVPGWDGNYTVFGNVVSGMNVVGPMAVVPVQGSGSRPVVDMELHSVTIRRVGAAAEAFSIETQGLPSVHSAPAGVIATTGGVAKIAVDVPPWSEVLFRVSTNGLASWQAEDWGYFSNAVPQRKETGPLAVNTAFFHASCVAYSNAWTAPESMRGRLFTAVWDTDPPTVFQVQFAATDGQPDYYHRQQGTNVLTGTLLTGPYAPQWTAFPYSAKLYLVDNKSEQTYSLWFDPGKATNRFTAVELGLLSGGRTLTGTFTLE